MLATSGIGMIVAFVLITVFGVCSQPEWSTCEISPAVPSVSHGVEIAVDGNSSTSGARRNY